MKVGYIGFGEVAFEISRGLQAEGLQGIVAYDPMRTHPKYGALLEERAKTAGVALLPEAQDVAKAVDVLIAAVPGAYALQAAAGIAEQLGAGKIYADVSTSSPLVKGKIAAIVEARGALFVDGALMGRLTVDRHKVPTLVSGSGAAAFIQSLSPYGMVLKKVSDKAGDAIAVKLVRSVYMKGIASLQVEMLEAATKLQVEDLVVESIGKTMDAAPFGQTMNMLVTAGAIHAERQTHEMEDCVAMLKDLGIQPIMTTATVAHLQYLAEKNLKERFNGEMPERWETVTAALGA